jgi:chemotaxis protein methyltransferase CheR
LADFGALDAAVASSSLPERSTASASWIVMVEQAAHSIEVLERSAAATSSAQVGRAGACAASMLVQARWLAQSERFVDALDVLSALPAEAARDSDTLLFRAILLTNQGQAAEAESICRQLLAQDELNAGAHYLMALCREHAGDREGAADHDQYALYLDPSLAMPRLHLGLMARRAGDRVAARRELGEALFLLTREDTPRILLLGGGFSRETLIALCRAELFACGGVR